MEEELIQKYQTRNDDFGYNIKKGGNNHTHSEETKRKIGEANKIALKGNYWSEEHRQMISKKFTGENNPFYGKTHSDDVKKLLSEKASQQRHSQETKEKMSKIRKGKYVYRSSDILNEEVAFHIKQMLVNGYTASEISKELDVDYKLINNIISNNTWSTVYVEGWDEFRNNRKTYSRITKEDHLEIYKLHIDDGLSKYELADMYGKTVKMIEKIFREQRKLYDNPVPSLN